MEHRAHLFDFAAFEVELLPLLREGLTTGSVLALRTFIEANKARLHDPNEGGLLSESWEDQIETRDVDQYGDVALTKFYDPSDDLGLGSDWLAIQGALLSAGIPDRAVLGTPVAVQQAIFDPGKMGSYFQSESEVVAHLHQLKSRALSNVEPLNALLERAANDKRGLYVTF